MGTGQDGTGRRAQAGEAGKQIAACQAELSYHEAREWEQMETRILEAEQQVEAICAEMLSPEVVSDGPRLQACYAKLQPAEDSVHALYARWAELEAKQQ